MTVVYKFLGIFSGVVAFMSLVFIIIVLFGAGLDFYKLSCPVGAFFINLVLYMFFKERYLKS